MTSDPPTDPRLAALRRCAVKAGGTAEDADRIVAAERDLALKDGGRLGHHVRERLAAEEGRRGGGKAPRPDRARLLAVALVALALAGAALVWWRS